MNFLAYAEKGDSGTGNIAFLMAMGGVALGVIVLAAIVCGAAMKRGHGRLHVVVACAVVWAALAGASGIYTLMQRSKWASEHELELESGYLDPTDTSGEPGWPVGIWIGLGAGYGGVWVFGMSDANKIVRE